MTQIVITIIGTKKVEQEESEFKIYSKDEVIERVRELLDEEYGFSVVEARK